jgi:hypothetical protein
VRGVLPGLAEGVLKTTLQEAQQGTPMSNIRKIVGCTGIGLVVFAFFFGAWLKNPFLGLAVLLLGAVLVGPALLSRRREVGFCRRADRLDIADGVDQPLARRGVAEVGLQPAELRRFLGLRRLR